MLKSRDTALYNNHEVIWHSIYINKQPRKISELSIYEHGLKPAKEKEMRSCTVISQEMVLKFNSSLLPKGPLHFQFCFPVPYFVQ